MAYQINLTGQEIDERLQNIGTAADNPDANGTLFARQNKNVDDIDELRDAVGHIDSAQTATDKTVTQHTADISTLQRALKTKANLANGKVSVTELPIATSLGNPDNGTIPSTLAVNEAINNKVVGLLHWQGVKSTTSEIKAITSAKKGDVWHSNGDGSEWVCTEDISTVNDSAWTELGTPIDLGGYYTKNEVDNKVKPLADSIGTDNDAASANGSLYARIKKNATDIYDYASKLSSGTLRDLYISAGAVYNEATGFYELNGLTDITEEQMRVIWQEDLSGWYRKGRTNLTRNIAYKGNDGGYSDGQKMSTICNGNTNLEVFNLGSDFYASYSFTAFQGCLKLREVSPQYKIVPYTESLGYNLFNNCPALQEVRFDMQYVTRGRVLFSESPLLSKESVLSIITTMGAVPKENPFVITLHPTAYARLKDDADIVAALEAKGGIVTLVSA